MKDFSSQKYSLVIFVKNSLIANFLNNIIIIRLRVSGHRPKWSSWGHIFNKVSLILIFFKYHEDLGKRGGLLGGCGVMAHERRESHLSRKGDCFLWERPLSNLPAFQDLSGSHKKQQKVKKKTYSNQRNHLYIKKFPITNIWALSLKINFFY